MNLDRKQFEIEKAQHQLQVERDQFQLRVEKDQYQLRVEKDQHQLQVERDQISVAKERLQAERDQPRIEKDEERLQAEKDRSELAQLKEQLELLVQQQQYDNYINPFDQLGRLLPDGTGDDNQSSNSTTVLPPLLTTFEKNVNKRVADVHTKYNDNVVALQKAVKQLQRERDQLTRDQNDHKQKVDQFNTRLVAFDAKTDIIALCNYPSVSKEAHELFAATDQDEFGQKYGAKVKFMTSLRNHINTAEARQIILQPQDTFVQRNLIVNEDRSLQPADAKKIIFMTDNELSSHYMYKHMMIVFKDQSRSRAKDGVSTANNPTTTPISQSLSHNSTGPKFYQHFPPIPFAMIDHHQFNPDQINTLLSDPLRFNSIQESDWKQSAFYNEFKSYQQHLLGPLKSQLQTVFDNDCPQHLLPKPSHPSHSVNSTPIQIEWRFPQLGIQVHWGAYFYYFSTLLQCLIPPSSSTYSCPHSLHPTNNGI